MNCKTISSQTDAILFFKKEILSMVLEGVDNKYHEVLSALDVVNSLVNSETFFNFDKELKAGATALYVCEKCFLKFAGKQNFSDWRDRAIHIRDYILAKIGSYGNNSEYLKNLTPNNFTKNYSLSSLEDEANKFFAYLEKIVVNDDSTGVNHIYRHEFINGRGEPEYYDFVELTSQAALNYEGHKMKHCVGSYYCRVKNGSTKIYSLRDKDNIPHITISLYRQQNEFGLEQMHGKGNIEPREVYHPAIYKFLTSVINVANLDGMYSQIPVIKFNDSNEKILFASLSKKQIGAIFSSGREFEFLSNNFKPFNELIKENARKELELSKYMISVFIKIHPHLKNLDRIESLVLNGATDSNMKYIVDFNNLKNLRISNSKNITNDAASFILKFNKLASIEISHTNMNEKGLLTLLDIKNLNILAVYGQPLGDSEELGLKIANHPSLTCLLMWECKLGNKFASAVAKSVKIRTFALPYNRIGGLGMLAFTGNRNMVRLNLDKNPYDPVETLNLLRGVMNGGYNLIYFDGKKHPDFERVLARNKHNMEGYLDAIMAGDHSDIDNIVKYKNAILFIAENKFAEKPFDILLLSKKLEELCGRKTLIDNALETIEKTTKI